MFFFEIRFVFVSRNIDLLGKITQLLPHLFEAREMNCIRVGNSFSRKHHDACNFDDITQKKETWKSRHGSEQFWFIIDSRLNHHCCLFRSRSCLKVSLLRLCFERVKEYSRLRRLMFYWLTIKKYLNCNYHISCSAA